MAAKIDDAPILKATSVKLAQDKIAILLYVHHTPLKENKGKDPSWYRYEGLVMKQPDLEALVKDLASDAKRTLPWKWLSKDPFWDKYHMSYDGGETNARFAAWLSCRIKHALPWDHYIDLVKNGNKHQANGKVKHSDSATYDNTEPWLTPDGKQVNILDQASLASALDSTFSCSCILKRSLPKNPTTI